MRHIPKAYERYRHFKGNDYQILAIAQNSEDASKQVVYQALYPPFTIYVRPLSMFMSEVDREKYPAAAQRYRFELVSEEEAVSEEWTRGEEESQSVTWKKAEDVAAAATKSVIPEAPESMMPEESQNTAQKAGEGITAESAGEPATEEMDAEWAIDENVLAFLEADTYEQKLNIFSEMRDKVTHDMLNTIAASLDIEVDSEELEERYRQIKNCLMTFQRYECNRLR